MTRPIAPDLHAFILDDDCLPDDSQMIRIQKQFRALLAVARAAGRDGWGSEHHDDEDCRLCHALDRLDRASSPKRRSRR